MDAGVVSGTSHPAPVLSRRDSSRCVIQAGAGKVPSTLRVTAALVTPSTPFFGNLLGSCA